MPEPDPTTIIVSLSWLDHIATVLESVGGAGTACAALFAWISRTRKERATEITAEITAAVSAETKLRESEINNLSDAVGRIGSSVVDLKNTCARQEDVTNIYRLLERHSDSAAKQQGELRGEIMSLVKMVTDRLDRLIERRLLPRDQAG